MERSGMVIDNSIFIDNHPFNFVLLTYTKKHNLKPKSTMTTIKISVRNKRDANLLYRMLKRIPFIDRIEKEDPSTRVKGTGQFEKIKNLMAIMAEPGLFKHITNPVTWQQNLRDEWE